MENVGEVRKSIVRISFKMEKQFGEVKNSNNDGNAIATQTIDMVTSGIIVLLEDEHCEIIAGSEMIQRCTDMVFHLNFPVDGGGYGDDVVISASPSMIGEHFAKFIVSTTNVDTQYIKQVVFETSPVRTSQNLFTFVFPMEKYVKPAGFHQSYVVDATSQVVFFISCRFHEYAPFGSPVFNERGQLVGICYAYQSRTHTWTVHALKKIIDDMVGEAKQKRISYVSNGVEIDWWEDE